MNDFLYLRVYARKKEKEKEKFKIYNISYVRPRMTRTRKKNKISMIFLCERKKVRKKFFKM